MAGDRTQVTFECDKENDGGFLVAQAKNPTQGRRALEWATRGIEF